MPKTQSCQGPCLPYCSKQNSKCNAPKKTKQTKQTTKKTVKEKERTWTESSWNGTIIDEYYDRIKGSEVRTKIEGEIKLTPGPKKRPYVHITEKHPKEGTFTVTGIYKGFKAPHGDKTFIIDYVTTGSHQGGPSTSYTATKFVKVDEVSGAKKLETMLKQVEALIEKGETGGGSVIRHSKKVP